MKIMILIFLWLLVPVIIVIGLYCKMAFEALKDNDYTLFIGAILILWVFVGGIIAFLLNI